MAKTKSLLQRVDSRLTKLGRKRLKMRKPKGKTPTVVIKSQRDGYRSPFFES